MRGECFRSIGRSRVVSEQTNDRIEHCTDADMKEKPYGIIIF